MDRPFYDSKRLVDSPAFLLSYIRSGSTLLRCLLDSHSQIYSGHESHLNGFRVNFDAEPTSMAMNSLGLSTEELECMLWDRVLFSQLRMSGKCIIVDKTPGNVSYWKRISKYWPNAKYLFLFRHPVNIFESIEDVVNLRVGNDSANLGADHPETPSRSETIGNINKFGEVFAEAANILPGLKIRYEDLVNQPELITQRICTFLDVPWEKEMLDYGRVDHGPFEAILGDWSEKIKSGTVGEARRVPELAAIPDDLRYACELFGYI